MIRQKCKICGKLFDARQKNHTICSPECRKINRTISNKTYRLDPVIRHKENLRQKEWHRKRAKIIPCRFCGEPVEAEFNGFLTIYSKKSPTSSGGGGCHGCKRRDG